MNNADITYDTKSTNMNFLEGSNLLKLLIIIAIFILIIGNWQYQSTKEHMSGGTLTQLYAQDAQDVNLKSNVDQIATGDYNLYWNQQYRVANTFHNRGLSLPSVFVNETTIDNNQKKENKKNNNESIKKLKKNIANKLNKPEKELNVRVNCNNYDDYLNNDSNCLNCLTDPNSCGNGEGGYRLGSDFVKAVDDDQANPYLGINGNVIYPDSYVGSYYTLPNFDINKPYPVIFDKLY